MDHANSIFRPQDATGFNQSVVASQCYHIRIPRGAGDPPMDFAAMFCGVGDGRHVFASLLDIELEFARAARSGSVNARRRGAETFGMVRVHMMLVRSASGFALR